MVRMSRLLDEALDLDEVGRRAWLASLSLEDQDIAAALREALSLGDTGTKWELATLPKIGFDDEAGSDSKSGLEPGARVGPYELIKLLGAGGMAEVWLARRADGAFKREVALKLPMMTRLRKDLEERFARERDILASLEHPNIARLYDAGSDSNGLPYLSMEYVDGQPITDWCDARKLGIADRLELILQVLDGIQYAHDRQVIHRDIKPSNIMVSENGQVRLLDFGIAKLLQTEGAVPTQLTSMFGRALTPDYASPEFLCGDDVDARSDIYSLGVLLYELLTGARPYRLATAVSGGGLERAITAVDVRKPSTQVDPQACDARAATAEKLARQLRGDLDVVVLKALQKDPAERYLSAATMAEDLRRHLRSEPIRARPPRLAYRLRKFVHRRRTGLAVAAMMVVIMLTVAGYELHRVAADPAREIAALPAAKPLGDKSIAVLPFLDMSEKKDQEYFSDGLSEELIDRLTQEPGLQVIARTSSFYFKNRPATTLQIARTLGVAHVLEGSVRRVGNTLRVTAQLIRADSGAHLWAQTFDRDVTDLFKLQDEIAVAIVGALKLKLVPAQFDNTAQSNNPEAYDQYLLGKQFFRRGNEEDYRRAVGAFRRATELDPGFAAAYAALSLAIADLAGYAAGESEFKEALAAANTALALAPQLAPAYLARFWTEITTWDYAAARADAQKALSLAPGDCAAERAYGVIMSIFGRLDEAIAVTTKAIALDPLDGEAWSDLGLYLTARRDFPAAHRALERSLAISPDNDITHLDLGSLELLEGHPDDAAAVFQATAFEGFRQMGEAMVEHARGHQARSRQLLDALIAKHADEAAYQIAEVYAWFGAREKTFAWLDRAYRQRDGGFLNVRVDPLFSSLQDDPRFVDLLRKLKTLE
jgi:serine/threonine-protein kinase